MRCGTKKMKVGGMTSKPKKYAAGGMTGMKKPAAGGSGSRARGPEKMPVGRRALSEDEMRDRRESDAEMGSAVGEIEEMLRRRAAGYKKGGMAKKDCYATGGVVMGQGGYNKGGDVKNWHTKRIILSKGASLYTRLITGLPVYDTTAGFVCYKKAFLEILDFKKIVFKGYAFQIQMKFAAYSLGFKIKEIPITFKDRELGVSKLSSNIIKEAIFGVLKIKWDSFFNTYKK
jgi:hypothetical protein